MLAELITIGDEILIGQIIDTNSAWIAKRLNELGIAVKQISSVADSPEAIQTALAEAASRADLILTTGGLGPTKDDLTKATLATYFNTGIHRDEKVLNHVQRFFERRKRPMLEVNRSQADVLNNAEVLFNAAGTAPGMWIRHNEKIYVVLPGVPFEMEHLMTEQVLPRLSALPGRSAIWHQTLLTGGIGESFLAQEIADIEDNLPAHIKLAYLPKLGTVRLRLTAVGDEVERLKDETSQIAEQIVQRIPLHIMAREDKDLAAVLLDQLRSKGLTLTTAESCTGGYLAHQLTSIAGSSDVFLGGAVTYSNKLKTALLGVSNITLAAFGAVSEQTALEMANGAKKQFNSDYAIAVTGIAGPDGGTADKPVGTVWIAVAGPQGTVAKLHQFGQLRLVNIERASTAALLMIMGILMKSLV
ncbi:nicotinamide-nucleotide amidase [bacterium A37T11]|nr:nicotinamide-nucleotide amidase [bacterium A37T11]